MAKNLKKRSPVTHCIWDMDGLMLNTEVVYAKVFDSIAAKHGKVISDSLRMKFLGSTEQRSCKTCVDELQLPITLLEFVDEFRAQSLSKLADVDFMPGAEKLIRHLHASGIPIAVGTSSGQDSVKVKTSYHFEVFEMFHHIVMGSSDPEVKEGKPAPDIFLLACARFPDKPDPSKCLVFEDAPNGVKAATSAGMQVVMVPAAYIPEEMKEGATMVLKSLEDFDPRDFGLPAYPDPL